MMCFKDKTYCLAKCRNVACSRQFNASEKAAAKLWWKGCEGEPPIAFSDFSSTCPDYQPDMDKSLKERVDANA